MADISELLALLVLVIITVNYFWSHIVSIVVDNYGGVLFLGALMLALATLFMYAVNKVRYRREIIACMVGALFFSVLFGDHVQGIAANKVFQYFNVGDWRTLVR